MNPINQLNPFLGTFGLNHSQMQEVANSEYLFKAEAYLDDNDGAAKVRTSFVLSRALNTILLWISNLFDVQLGFYAKHQFATPPQIAGIRGALAINGVTGTTAADSNEEADEGKSVEEEPYELQSDLDASPPMSSSASSAAASHGVQDINNPGKDEYWADMANLMQDPVEETSAANSNPLSDAVRRGFSGTNPYFQAMMQTDETSANNSQDNVS